MTDPFFKVGRIHNGLSFDAFMEVTAENRGLQLVTVELTGLEKEGAKIIAKPNEGLKQFSARLAEQRLGANISNYPL